RDMDPTATERLGAGLHTFDIEVPARLLAPTTYLLTIGSGSKHLSKHLGVIDHQHACCEFTLRDLSMQDQSRPGVLGVQLPWSHRNGESSAAAERFKRGIEAQSGRTAP